METAEEILKSDELKKIIIYARQYGDTVESENSAEVIFRNIRSIEKRIAAL
jgi:hypothetical protein